MKRGRDGENFRVRSWDVELLCVFLVQGMPITICDDKTDTCAAQFSAAQDAVELAGELFAVKCGLCPKTTLRELGAAYSCTVFLALGAR